MSKMITSTSNPQVKRLLQIQKKSKARDEEGVFVVEGLRMFVEVPKERVEKTYVSETFYNKKKHELNWEEFPLEILSDSVFKHVSDTQTPQGVLCIVKREKYDVATLLDIENPHFMVLDNLQDPGNLGTIVRTAEGAGVDAVFMSKDCVDIYNPKTIRSTMGSIYRMPTIYIEDTVKLLELFKEKGIKSYAAHLDGKNSYDKEDYRTGTAILIGNEGNGLRDEVSNKADIWVRIPMEGQVESLNAAIAASVLMFEVARQRR
jgi:TrmH family RNA methyltransferase